MFFFLLIGKWEKMYLKNAIFVFSCNIYWCSNDQLDLASCILADYWSLGGGLLHVVERKAPIIQVNARTRTPTLLKSISR